MKVDLKEAMANGVSEQELRDTFEQQMAEAKKAFEAEKKENDIVSQARINMAEAIVKYFEAIGIQSKSKSKEELVEGLIDILMDSEKDLKSIFEMGKRFNELDNFIASGIVRGKRRKNKIYEEDAADEIIKEFLNRL